jgi:alpha-L-arabinofuranosidase
LFVDAGQNLGPVSPLVYGTNTGPWQNLSSSMLPYVEQAGFALLRFPGGNWGDEYLLTEARFDEFVALARELDAEPMVNVRLFKTQPEKAGKWVEYANVTRGYGIRYWGIGNEPSLYASKRGLDDYDTAAFNQEWREFALAMKAVDPSILLVGPEIHQYTGTAEGNPLDQHGKDWMREFLIANGDLVDVVSFHRYPFGSYEPQIGDLRQNSAEWDTIIPSLQSLVLEITGRDLPIAVTEVNSNWTNQKGGEATPDSFYNAIWWADVQGRLIAQHVDIVAQFALEGAGGLGLMGHPAPRPTYYVYLLYKEFGSELVYTSSDDPLVRVYAARREDGALTVMVVNLGPDEVTKPLRLDNFVPGSPGEIWLLDTDHLVESIGRQQIASGDALVLPAESVSLYILPR